MTAIYMFPIFLTIYIPFFCSMVTFLRTTLHWLCRSTYNYINSYDSYGRWMGCRGRLVWHSLRRQCVAIRPETLTGQHEATGCDVAWLYIFVITHFPTSNSFFTTFIWFEVMNRPRWIEHRLLDCVEYRVTVIDLQ